MAADRPADAVPPADLERGPSRTFGYVEAAQLVTGPAAYVLSRHLTTNPLPEAVTGAFEAFWPQVLATVAGIHRAGDAWRATVAMSASGHADMVLEQVRASSRQDDQIGVEEAAEMLGVSPRHVRRLIATGELAATKPGGAWLLTRSEVETYASTRAA